MPASCFLFYSISNSSATFVGTACPGAGRGRQLLQHMYNKPRYLCPPLAGVGGGCRRSIIIELEMELLISRSDHSLRI